MKKAASAAFFLGIRNPLLKFWLDFVDTYDI